MWRWEEEREENGPGVSTKKRMPNPRLDCPALEEPCQVVPQLDFRTFDFDLT